uniref:Secreted protein n=1 Tax=Romanomermis culicivorax TaxID=13658 RepID=A0A915KW07_ROMCU
MLVIVVVCSEAATAGFGIRLACSMAWWTASMVDDDGLPTNKTSGINSRARQATSGTKVRNATGADSKTLAAFIGMPGGSPWVAKRAGGAGNIATAAGGCPQPTSSSGCDRMPKGWHYQYTSSSSMGLE